MADKIRQNNGQGALAAMYLPHQNEIDRLLQSAGMIDPIGDHRHQESGSRLIHRYHNRILLPLTTSCPISCRFCFRRNEMEEEREMFQIHHNRVREYLLRHPEVEEVILSGGDPLMFDDEMLKRVISFLDVPYLRIHTKTLTVLPSRVDASFIELLTRWKAQFKKVTLVIHINHLDEIDHQVVTALDSLDKTGIQLLAQTVLLNGVNDNPESLSELFIQLTNHNIRPYYLHHPDRVRGGMHFYLPLERGRKIYRQLRSLLPGWAIPQYVIDIPGGAGKVEAAGGETLQSPNQLIDLDGKEVPFVELD